MRIGLNLLHAMPEVGGVWNYIANLVKALAELDRTNEYVAFANRHSRDIVPDVPNMRRVDVPIRSESRMTRILYENSLLQVMAARNRLDCIHWFANTRGLFGSTPSAVTIYDLLPIVRAAPFGRWAYTRLMVGQTAKRADVLLPISQATAGDLERLLGAERRQMVIVPPILSSEFSVVDKPLVDEFRERHGLPRHFWLYVAHLYPHKNHARLVRAYHQLKRRGADVWPLVLRGDPKGTESEALELIDRFRLSDDVVFVPRLPPRDMVLLYNCASALVFPSLFEGGGIPLIEALGCGCPVACSGIPAAREHAEAAAVYFDPRHVDSIADAMLDLQSREEVRLTLRERGLERARNFRPERVVGRLTAAYESCRRA